MATRKEGSPSTTEAGRATRERILSVARQLFYEQGFNETTFSAICAEAGVNHNTFAYHLKSKLNAGVLIYTEMLKDEERQLRALYPDKDDADIMFLDVAVHQRLLFDDLGYRRFSSQMVAAGVDSFVDDRFEHYHPVIFRFYKGMLDERTMEFYLSAAAGADMRIEPYIVKNLEKLDYAETVRNTCSVYCSFAKHDLIASYVDEALRCVEQLDIRNEGFDVRITLGLDDN